MSDNESGGIRRRYGIMQGTLEERIARFTVDFVRAVVRVSRELITADAIMVFGDKTVELERVADFRMSAADCLEYAGKERVLEELAGNRSCVAYMNVGSVLYNKIYGYQAYQEDIYEDSDEAERLFYAIRHTADKYGLWFEWNGWGGILFYDDTSTAVSELLQYEFYDGERTECPIAVVGPKGGGTQLRVYAYGGVIGQIDTVHSKNAKSRYLADPEYAKYLGRLSNDCEADRNYMRYMQEQFADFSGEDGDVQPGALCARLSEMLEESFDFMLKDAEYLGLILKAAQMKFRKKAGSLGERRIQTAIVRQHMKKEPQDGWCVIDMEYTVSRDVNPGRKKFKPDIVVYDREYGFGLIELKYNNENAENLEDHYINSRSVINDPAAAGKIAKELTRRSRYLREYGLIDPELFASMTENSRPRLWQGFLFVGGDRQTAVRLVKGLAEQQAGILADEDCRFAFFPFDGKDGEGSAAGVRLDYGGMERYGEFVGG